MTKPNRAKYNTRLRVLHVNNVAEVPVIATQGAQKLGWPWQLWLIPPKNGNIVTAIFRRISDWIPARKVIKNADIVHVHYLPNSYYFVGKGHLKVAHIHGSDIRYDYHSKIWGWLCRYGIKHADLVVYATPDLKEFVEPIRPDAIFLPNPVPEYALNMPPATADLDFIINSRLDDSKGALLIIEAAKYLIKAGYEVHAIDWGQHREKAKVAGIKLHPKLSPEDYCRFLQRGRVVLGQFNSGALGIADLMTLALGRPLISNITIEPIAPPAISIATSDPKALSDCCLETLRHASDNPKTAQIQWLINNGRTPTNYVKTLADLYTAILSKRGKI